jgi:antitoxin ParD1/3/4
MTALALSGGLYALRESHLPTLHFGNLCHMLFSTKEATLGTMNISLPDPMKSWVEDQSRSGRYANSSDYVRDLIRRDRQRAEALADLQGAIDEGLASGPAEAMDRGAFKASMRNTNGE